MKARNARYSTARWRRLREQVVRMDGRRYAVPGCTSDMSLPRVTQVDHVTEVEDGGAFWDPTNLLTVCKYHHYSKSIEVIGERTSGRSRQSSRFPADGHWNDKPGGREWASPNGLGCDNPACRRCLSDGYRKEKTK